MFSDTERSGIIKKVEKRVQRDDDDDATVHTLKF
jgi:hypothetical protein